MTSPLLTRCLLPILLAIAVAGCGPSQNKSPSTSTAETSESSTVPEITPSALAKLNGKVRIDGSSSLYPVTEAVAEDFQNAVKKAAGTSGNRVDVPVAHAGTGGGFKRFVRGEIDICNASRPISTSEMTACQEANIEYIELPVCFDALTVAVHPSNTLKSITVAQLKTMWEPEAEKKVLNWNQVDASWPDRTLRLFGAGADSGTFDYFTEAVVGKARSSRTDYTGSEDDNALVQGIRGDEGALGYVPFAYYIENKDKIKSLAIDWEKDELGPVEPELKSVMDGIYNPLSRPLFIYVNKKSVEEPHVKAFVEYYIANAPRLVKELQYIPFGDDSYAKVASRFRQGKSGSAFKGKPEVGLKINELLDRENQ